MYQQYQLSTSSIILNYQSSSCSEKSTHLQLPQSEVELKGSQAYGELWVI